MGANTATIAKTIPWSCPKCNAEIALPIDILNNGQSVSCPNCSYHAVLPRPTFPFRCVKCGTIFGALESTRTLGGYVTCPACQQRYRRATRKIIEDVTQDHGRLIPVNS